jgi:hypothetical protein
MASYLGRRKFLATLGGAAAWSFAVRAQQPERMRRVGVLIPLAADDPESPARVTALAQGLQQLGWTDGRNLRIDYRWAAGTPTAIAYLQPNWSRLPRTLFSPVAVRR